MVVLNSDVEARPGWLACLQYAASQEDDVGVVGARLLYPDGRIQFAGTVRNLGAPEWFDHRYRFKPADWGPAAIPGAGAGGDRAPACTSRARRSSGSAGFDEAYPMAYEDVDCACARGRRGCACMYFPAASLFHHESVTRGTDVGERELASQRLFWERWGDFFDARDVRAASGGLRIVYVTEGHRRRWRPPRHLRAPQPPAGARPRGRAVHARRAARLVRAASACAQLRVLRRTRRSAVRARRDQGGHLVEHGGAGVAGERAARDPRVLRSGHRDLLLPGRRVGAPRRARLLPARVPLHDDLLVEPRAPARAGPGCRADPAGHRPGDLPPVCRRAATRGHGARARALEPAEEPAADA